jgi:hypothetical protein
MRSTRIPMFPRLARGETKGIAGSTNAPGLPTFPQGNTHTRSGFEVGRGWNAPLPQRACMKVIGVRTDGVQADCAGQLPPNFLGFGA